MNDGRAPLPPHFRARKGTTAVVRIPVLPEATPAGPLSAQSRRLRPRSATSAIRRSSRLLCAKSGHSLTPWRTGAIRPLS